MFGSTEGLRLPNLDEAPLTPLNVSGLIPGQEVSNASFTPRQISEINIHLFLDIPRMGSREKAVMGVTQNRTDHADRP